MVRIFSLDAGRYGWYVLCLDAAFSNGCRPEGDE
jgi:hypothetical protein